MLDCYSSKRWKVIKKERYLKEDDCDIFIRYNEAIDIVNKVKQKHSKF